MSINWEKCADLPFATAAGQTTVINEKVYFGGGITDDDSKRYLVYCYSTKKDLWTTLPQLPVKWFGLGQFSGKLTAVGGVKKEGKNRSEVYTFDSHKWKSMLPPMTLARTFPAVTSLSDMLIVAGGTVQGESTSTVEIFQQLTSQWQTVAPLPIPCCNLSLVSTGDNNIFALGGYNQPSKLNQVMETSISDLLKSDVKKTKTWRTLQSSPNYQPAATTLCGNILIAAGGWKASEGKPAAKSMHVYSPATNSWIYFSDLPEPRAWSSCGILSAREMIVIGGKNEDKVKSVYRGTLDIRVV